MSDRLVCEFAYIRQGENESDEVNRFPSGQTHVGFTNLYFKGYSSDWGRGALREIAYALQTSSLKDCSTIAYGSDSSRRVSRNSGSE